MAGVDVVHHVAAAFREVAKPDQFFYDVNVTGTRTVLEAAERQGVGRFVHCSTCGVHGDVRDPPAAEDAPITPSDYYQHTKWLGEIEVQRFAGRGLNTVVLRPCAIYGPGDPGRFRLLFQRVASGRFPMFGPGTAKYHTLFIDNFVDALILATDQDRATGGTYLVADEECLSIEQLVKEVARAIEVSVKIVRLPLTPLVIAGHVVEQVCRPFGVSPPIFPRRVDWYRQNRAFDVGRARKELCYTPRISLREGLLRAAAWYKEHGFLAEGSSQRQ
jgi:nucleoside-diphosphate-sugar epimerase